MFTFNRIVIIFSFSIAGFILLAVAPVQPHEMHRKTAHDIHVIFDLNGVLVQTASATKVLGSQQFLKLALIKILSLKNPLAIRPDLKKKLFMFLDSIEPRKSDETLACDEDGNLLPQIMCDYLKGTQSSQNSLAKINAASTGHTGLENAIVATIARMIFTPEKFCLIQQWVPGAIDFIKELKAEGCKVYILSNWDKESFTLFKEAHADTFALFDGILLSGDVGLIKPDRTIYELLINKFTINKERALFFDDQPVNVKAALEYGITSGICKQTTSMLGSKTPHINDLKNQYHNWRYHQLDQKDCALEACANTKATAA